MIYKEREEKEREEEKSIKNKIKIINACFPLIAKIKDVYKIHARLKALSEILDLDQSLITMEFKKFRGKK